MSKESTDKKDKCGFGKFVLGIVTGAALGILFAPKSGKETRLALRKKADDLLSKAKQLDAKEVRDTIEDKVHLIMDELRDLDKEKIASIAKKKANQIRDGLEELVDYTKKKATPVVEEAADALRQKAIVATKKVLKRLEDN